MGIHLSHPLAKGASLFLVGLALAVPAPARAGLLGWATGHNGTILHTSDGGVSWAAWSSGTGELLFGVAFVSTGVAAVPEPGSLALVSLGALGLLAYARRHATRCA